MVIYIDVLIFVNLLINYTILCATKRFLCLKSNQVRLIAASFVSALFTLTMFLNVHTTIFSILIKVLCTGLMCFIAFYKSDFYTYIKSICVTSVFSIIFSGVMILYYNTVKPKNMAIVNDTLYIHINPVVLLSLSVVFYILFLLVRKLLSQNTLNSIVKVRFTVNDTEYSCIGKVDTGNSLTEPFSGMPVIVVEKSVLTKVDINKPRIIPYKVLGNDGFLYGVKAQKVYIDEKEIQKDIYIGIYNGEINKDFKSIINSQIIR